MIETTRSKLQIFSRNVLEFLDQCHNQSYGDYLTKIYNNSEAGMPTRSAQSQSAFEIVLEKIRENFGHGASSQLEVNPVIQTGNHNQLLLDKYTFHTFVAQFTGTHNGRFKHMFAHTTSAISLETKHRFGPMWIDSGTNSHRLLDLSVKQRRGMSVGGTNTVSLYRDSALWNSDCEFLAVVDKKMPWNIEDRLSRLTLAANKSIIEELTRGSEIEANFFDESIVASIVECHLERNTAVAEMLLDESFMNRIDSLFRTEKWGVPIKYLLPHSPFFWHQTGRKIHQMTRFPTHWTSSSPTPLVIHNDRESIRLALRSGVIIPGPFLTALALGILPRIRLVGGLRQIAYLPIYCRMLVEAGAANFDIMTDDSYSQISAWGMRVKNNNIAPISLASSVGASRIFLNTADADAALPLRQIANDFSIFMTHPLWSKLVVEGYSNNAN